MMPLLLQPQLTYDELPPPVRHLAALRKSAEAQKLYVHLLSTYIMTL